MNRDKNWERAWSYIRFGEKGNSIFNDENGRKIIRQTSYIDTLWFSCSCWEDTWFKGTLEGRNAIDWVLGLI